MKTIFLLEIKKSFNSIKNKYVVLLYIVLLLVFVLSNAQTFGEVRKAEVDFLNAIAAQSSMAAPGIEAFIGTTPPHRDNFPWEMEYFALVAGHLWSFAENNAALAQAVIDNDRAREVQLFNQISQNFYQHIYSVANIYSSAFGHAQHPASSVYLGDWADFNREMATFTQYLYENNIPSLYRSEMVGVNFVYQFMQIVMPLVVMLLAFLVISDVFTDDNKNGSYKFLLLQPISRIKIFAAKIISAWVLALGYIFVPLTAAFIVISLLNGLGPVNYPVLVQENTFVSITPTPNNRYNDQIRGFATYTASFYRNRGNFTYRGFAYVPENPSFGISTFSSWEPYRNKFIPHESLTFRPILSVILLSIPLFTALLFFASVISALIGVISQNSVLTLALGCVISILVFAFPTPEQNISFLQRLNPFLYTNPVSVLNGLSSTTALTGMLSLLGFGLIAAVVGCIIFVKQDIVC